MPVVKPHDEELIIVNPLIECIPNFSEGRRPEVIEEIVESIRQVPDVYILDYSLDHDHNRSVITFAGSPEGVEEAAFRAVETASKLINLDEHQGEHPRIGATDVVPFVPIRDVTMDECIQIANRLGQRVGSELSIPVYLYEKAATHPDRVNLAWLRKGNYEGLKEAIITDPGRQPDFGPAELGTAGATVIGARVPLIAYNVYLNTDDVGSANRIAKTIRHSGGGLRYVKALGMSVEGLAQVSMNLTDYTGTPIHRVQELIKVEAARYGHQIAFAELIGLIPEQALVDVARWYLQLDRFDDDQILERKMRAAEQGQKQQTLNGFIESIADGSPTPGGGSVSALAGALASALAMMVARLTVGKKKYAEVEDHMHEALIRLDELRHRLMQAVEQDALAFNHVMDAYLLDKDSPERAGAIRDALSFASYIPYLTASLSWDVMKELNTIAQQGNVNAATDAAVGVRLSQAAIEGAILNILINLKDLDDEWVINEIGETVADIRASVMLLRQDARALAQDIAAGIEERIGLV